MPPTTTKTVDPETYARSNPRDGAFAFALAMSAAANGETANDGDSKPRAAAKPKVSAKDEFRALVEAKLEARIQAKRRFNAHARLSTSDTLRAQEEVHKEHADLRARMIAEANADRSGYGTSSRK